MNSGFIFRFRHEQILSQHIQLQIISCTHVHLTKCTLCPNRRCSNNYKMGRGSRSHLRDFLFLSYPTAASHSFFFFFFLHSFSPSSSPSFYFQKNDFYNGCNGIPTMTTNYNSKSSSLFILYHER